MEKLEFNDYVSNIFVFTIKEGVYQYYFSDKVEWFMDGWPYFYRDKNIAYISETLNKLIDDKVCIKNVKEEFERLDNEHKHAVIENHLPMLYVDFDNKILKSRYHEQSLHYKTLEGWMGKFENFLDAIPKEYKYWEKDQLEV